MRTAFTCNLCDAMCGLHVEVNEGKVGAIRGNPDDVFSRGHICPKATSLRELLDDPDRLRAPVRRTASGSFEPIGWEEAYAFAARRISEVRARHGNDAVAIYVGNPTVHNHRASLGSQLLTAALATKNRFDPNSQDSAPRLFACMQVYGDPLSIPVPDIDRTDHLLVIGANPAASNGSMMGLGDVRKRMQSIRARGGTVTLIDPRRTETAAWATRHHFIRPGGDAAFLLAILHVLFAEKRIDEKDVWRIASGLGTLRELAADFDPERVSHAIEIGAEDIRAIAREFASAKRACAYGRIGTCQNEFGPVASWLIEALNIVTGNFDREGGAMFPTPPADIAPLGRLLVGAAWGRWHSRVRKLPELLGSLPSAVLSEEIETEGEGQIRAFVCFAGNPVLSTPNGDRLERALAKLEHLVAIDFYVNETSRHAHVILPPSHVFETGNFDLLLQRFSVRNVAKYSAPILQTTDDTRDDWTILFELAMRIRVPAMFHAPLRALAKNAPERIVDLLLRSGPHEGLTLDRLREAKNGLDLGPLVPRARAHVQTVDGRVRLAPDVFASAVSGVRAWLDRPKPALVLIGRRHLRSNNSWMHNVPSLVKGPSRAQLQMSPRDAADRGFEDGARVRVTSRTGSIVATLAIRADMMPGVVSLPHGFGHSRARETLRIAGALEGASANTLTDEVLVDPILGTSVLNGVPVEVEKLGNGPY